MKATEIMTRDPLTVGPKTPLAVALGLMLNQRISGLPVIDGDRQVVGMLTEGDLLHRVETGTGGHRRSRWMEFLLGDGRSAADYVRTHSRLVGDLMTRDVASVQQDATLQEVVDLMEHRKIRRVPVLRGQVLIGIISRHDLIRALATKLVAAAASLGESDIDLEARLKAELKDQPWFGAANISIAVKDHVAVLEGFIGDERVRQALTVAARNMAEDMKVDDRLVWADLTSGMVVPA